MELQRAGVHADSSDSRCASTSCISPAIRRRSASRAASTCARCSASSPSARSCEVRSRSRCVRVNSPQRDHHQRDQRRATSELDDDGVRRSG